MADIRITTNKGNLNSVLTSASRRVLTQRARSVLDHVQSSDSAVKDSMRYTVDGSSYKDMSARVGSNDPTARFDEEGTKPHVIRARNAKVLRFPGTNAFSGQIIHTAMVMHPGTKGKHTLKEALRAVIGR